MYATVIVMMMLHTSVMYTIILLHKALFVDMCINLYIHKAHPLLSICSCIRGYLRNKSVILVTHQLQFAAKADRLLALKAVSRDADLYIHTVSTDSLLFLHSHFQGRVEIYCSQEELVQKQINLSDIMTVEDKVREREEWAIQEEEEDNESDDCREENNEIEGKNFTLLILFQITYHSFHTDNVLGDLPFKLNLKESFTHAQRRRSRSLGHTLLGADLHAFWSGRRMSLAPGGAHPPPFPQHGFSYSRRSSADYRNSSRAPITETSVFDITSIYSQPSMMSVFQPLEQESNEYAVPQEKKVCTLLS